MTKDKQVKRTVVGAGLRLKRWWFWQIALAALAMVLCFVPLLNVLGYEFCLVLGLAGSLASLHLGSVAANTARHGDQGLLLGLEHPARALLRLWARSAANNLLLFAAPLSLILLNTLRVKNCNIPEGLAFFAVLPIVNSSIASGVGLLWGLAVPRPALATLSAMMTLLASLLWGLWRFYDAPAIFAYDPFVGYFAGALYDGTVSIDAPLLWARLYHLCGLGSALLLAAHLLDPGDVRLRLSAFGSGRWLTSATLLLLGATALLGCMGGSLGFNINAQHVRRELGGVRHTSHFTIVYPKEMPAAKVALLVEDHEFRHAQLLRWFGKAPGRITSYIFRSAAEKRRLMGAGRTFIAKPWRNEIYIQKLGFPHVTLKHELAHIFAGSFGDPLFKISLAWRWTPLPHPRFSVGLIEGVAVAADFRPFGDSTVHQRALALVKLGLAPPLAALFGARFLAQASSRAYTLAGSFCRYLADQYGRDKLLAAYRAGGEWDSIFGKHFNVLHEEWRQWIQTVELPDPQLKLAEEQFRRPSIFSRVCAHEVEALRQEAGAAARRGDPARAAEILTRVCAFDPGDPSHALERVHALLAAGDESQARSAANALLKHRALSKPLRRRVQLLLGDVHWRCGDLATARSWYRRASGHAATTHGRRLLTIKVWSLAQPPALRKLLRRYLVPRLDRARDGAMDVHLAYAIQSILKDKSGFGHYLVGKQLAARERWADAASALGRALTAGLQWPEVRREALRVSAVCRYRSRDPVGAKKALDRYSRLPGLAAGDVLWAEEWKKRLLWRAGDVGWKNRKTE